MPVEPVPLFEESDAVPPVLRPVFSCSPLLQRLLFALLLVSAHAALAQTPTVPPQDVQLLAAQADAAQVSGNLPGAIALYQQALQQDPAWIDGWFLLGKLQYGTDQFVQARASFTNYIERAPTATAAMALRGLCEFETGDYQASLEDIDHAIAGGAGNQPRNGQILLYHQALLLTRLGRFDEAIAKYTAFIKQGIINPDVASGIALAGLQMPLLPPSIDPADATLVASTGQAAIEAIAGDPAAARASFAAVLQQFPGRPHVHYFCGYLLFTTHPNLALEEFRLELADHPKDALAHAMLAWGAELRGEYAAALPEAQAAVATDPALPLSQLVLGRALAETSDLGGAVEHLDQVISAQPANLEAHLSLAKAYSKLGKKDDAHRERLICLQLSGTGVAADANR